MKSSIEKRKFLNPFSTLDLAWSAVRAHRPKDGSIHIRTYWTGPNGSGLGRKTSPSASARAFIRSSSSRYAVWKPPSIRMARMYRQSALQFQLCQIIAHGDANRRRKAPAFVQVTLVTSAGG